MGAPFRSGIVAVIGGANVGKSTLVNALVGRKVAAVSDKPQTTRLRALGIKHDPRGQLILMDTPGITEPRILLEEKLVHQAFGAIREADVVLFLLDATKPIGPWEDAIFRRLPGLNSPVVLAVNKLDLVTPERLDRIRAEACGRFPFRHVHEISALRGDGLGALEGTLWDLLPEGPPYFPPGMTSSLPLPLQIGEIIREKVMCNTREEIPHAVAVSEVELIEEESRLRVNATLIVEHNSQKGILIGKGGSMLNLIGREAREDIENLVGRHVFLELWVKVKEKWRRREDFLKTLGFSD